MSDVTLPPISLPDLGWVSPFASVEQFTYREGISYAEQIEALRAWVEYTLVPYLNTELPLLSETVSDQLGVALTALAASNVTITDAAVATLLNAASSATKTYLDIRYGFQNVYWAPAPSGTDDTAVLQTLITAAMSNTGAGPGVVLLRHGRYKVSTLTTASGYWQPIIRGRGYQTTYVKSLNSTNPVFQIVGTSGSTVSGAIEDITVEGADTSAPTVNNGVGVDLIGCGAFTVRRVQFNNLTTGLRFYNRDINMFTEFCVAEDCVWNFCKLPVEYKIAAGSGSFNGSGVVGNSIANLIPNESFMKIGTGCNVYNAPVSATIFTPQGSTSGNLIVNNSTYPALTYGIIRAEIQGGEYTIGWPGGSNIYFAGNVLMWGGPTHLGRLFLVDKVVSTSGTTLPYLRPWNTKQTLNTGTTPIMGGAPIYGPGSYDCEVDVFGPSGYWYSYTLRAWHSGTSTPAVIDVLKTRVSNDPGSVGAPTFAWDSAGGNGLTITNNNYNTSFTVSASYRQLTHQNAGDNLGQF